MTELLAMVLNGSITASLIVLAVVVIRMFLKKAPGIFSYVLWIVVFLRFLIPVSWEADFAIMPALSVVQVRESHSKNVTEHTYTPNELQTESDNGQAGVPGTDSAAEMPYAGTSYAEEDSEAEENIYLPNEMIEETEYLITDENGSSMEISIAGRNMEISAQMVRILTCVWLGAALLLILYMLASYGIFMGRLHRTSAEVVTEEGKKRSLYIWTSSAVKTPFVAGIFCPVVYLPETLTIQQRELILEHEKVHMKRLDYLAKPFMGLVCCIHWFNPFVWLAFYLMERDMESSCDEAVLRKIGYDRKKEYANTLLSIAETGVWKPGHPIAFGENSIKSRIKRTVKLKKAKPIVVVTGAVVTVVAVILLLVNRPYRQDDSERILLINRSDSQSAQDTAEPVTLPELPEELEVEEEWTQPETSAEQSGPADRQEQPKSQTEIESNADVNADVEKYFPHEEIYEEIYKEGGGNQITNYVPSRDHFENILLQEDDNTAVVLVGILYDYPVVYTRIADTYGTRIHPVTQEEKLHSGIDFVAEEGTAVTAAADGKVIETGFDTYCGNYIIIQHINGDMTYYTQCETIIASEGDEVTRGEQIATVGSTGTSTGAHLHFAVSRNGSYVEPQFAENIEE